MICQCDTPRCVAFLGERVHATVINHKSTLASNQLPPIMCLARPKKTPASSRTSIGCALVRMFIL